MHEILGLSALVAPSIAVWLSKVKLNVGSLRLDSENAANVAKSQLLTIIIFDVVTVLIAPLFYFRSLL